MSAARSPAYWQGNRYRDEKASPEPDAPLRDLPSAASARFGQLRTGLLALAGVAEHVKFMGDPWRWAWEYAIGSKKLCWVHVIADGVSVTFSLNDHEEALARSGPKLPAAIARAAADGQRTGPVRWCWVDLKDRASVDAFLGFAARKADWLVTLRPDPRRRGG